MQRRYITITGVLLVMLLLAMFPDLFQRAVFAVRSTGEDIVQYRFETETEGWMGDPLIWSPDGHRLLSGMLKKDSSGRIDRVQASLWLFDVSDDKAVGRKVLDDRGAADAYAAWSPDGELVVMAEMSRIRVLSVSKSEIVAHREFDLQHIEIDGYPRTGANPSVAFSSDSASFWIVWPDHHARERFTLALKLDANSLKVIDRFEIDPPIQGNRHEAYQSYVEATPKGPRLVARVDSFENTKTVFEGYTAHWFIYGVDLTTKTEIFPHFQWVEEDAPFRTPGDTLLSPDASAVLVSIGRSSRPTIAPEIRHERDYELYQTGSGQRSSFFDTAETLKGQQFNPKFFGKTGDVLISLSATRPNHPDGLLALRASDGVILQRIAGPALYRLAFSLDRTRMAGSLQIPGTGIQFYSVSR
jgi:hypothetical protein